MNLLELKLQLVKMKVPESAYCLSGGLPSEAVCIELLDGIWRVYYSERGGRSSVKTFVTEKDACDYFLVFLQEDSHIKQIIQEALTPRRSQ